MSRISPLLLGIGLAIGLGDPAAAIDNPVLYLRKLPQATVDRIGARSQYNLSECITGRITEQQLQIHVRTQREEAFLPFFSLASAQDYVLPAGTATAHLILTTGSDGTMSNCAVVTVDLFRETTGGRVPLASGSVKTTLVPPRLGGTANTVQVPIVIEGAAAARTFAKGEALSAVFLVKNICFDASGRNITLRFDSIDRLSRLEFPQIPPPPPGGPADPDGDGLVSICDNCPEDANPDQSDADGDGQGNVCTPCIPGGPKPPACNCAIAQCDDDDPCTLDVCDPQKGCVRDPLVFLAALQCRLDVIENSMLTAPPADLTPKLARRKGALRRLIRKDRKLAVKAQRAIDRNKPEKKIGKKVTKVRRTLGKFVDKVETLPGGMSTDLRAFILDQSQLAEQAIRTTP